MNTSEYICIGANVVTTLTIIIDATSNYTLEAPGKYPVLGFLISVSFTITAAQIILGVISK